MSETNSKKENIFIVGIGCSAGGLKALEEFFDYCPSDTNFAFVIIQHLSPDYKSLLPELLSRHTVMSVKEANEGDVLESNHVYLIPGNKNIQVEGGKLILTKRLPTNQINFSVDIFFNSLAIESKERSLAVILSGTGSDGTKGAKAIKEIGGTVFVQSPESSDFDGMPKSVIIQGLADFILEPKDIAREIVDFTSHQHYQLPGESAKEANNEEALNRILKIIKNHIGYDFFSYKKPTLFRRTAKRVNITKCATIEDYIDYLHAHPKEKRLLTQEFLIGVTKFFRDFKAFEIIREQIIPKIAAKKQRGEIIKIWTVACSTGEEAYSLAILIDQYLRENNLDIDYKVFATDLDERAIEIATKGIYNEHIESEISHDILSQYFAKRDNEYIIQPNIRKNIIFSKHDILMNPPFNKMDLVSCRNMLIYMENNIQNKVLYSLHYALNLGGYLFLGNSENLGVISKNFDVVSNKWKIFKNIQEERGINLNSNSLWRIGAESKPKISLSKSKQNIEDRIAKVINKTLIDKFSTVCVCIDDSFEIIHAEGKLKKFMQYPEEGYSNNLLKILPDELNIPISTSIRKNRTSPEDIIEKEVRYVIDNNLKQIQILVSSFSVPTIGRRCYLITIIELLDRKVNIDEQSFITNYASNSEQVLELKEALNETRENLQTTIEELETSNEEMQATNEELLASNEELQSANEELQSLNEELHTVNSELQEKNEQLIILNSDVENLINNTNIGTLFLDKGFKIRKYTPVITEHFKLRSEDVGRSITHFSGTIAGDDLITYSREVIQTLRPFSIDLEGAYGKWYTLQIFPYRSEQDSIEGVVVNFIDITDLKKAHDEKQQLNIFFEHLMEYSPAIIYIFNVITKENVYSSTSIGEVAGYSIEDIKSLGNQLLPTIIHDDDLEKVFKHQEKMKKLKMGEVLKLEYRIVQKDTNEPIWILSSDKVNELDENGNVKTIVGIAQVVSEFKELELKVQESEERFRFALSASRSGLWEWDSLNPEQIWISDDLKLLIGNKSDKVSINLSAFRNLIHKDHLSLFNEKITQNSAAEKAFEIEIKIKTKTNGYRWFRVNGQKKLHDSNKQLKIIGTIFDIDAKKLSEQKMKELNIELERFAYLASHDLKEPLRTITSFTHLFKEEYKEFLNADTTQYLDFIEDASSRMITLTNDLLKYSQLDNKSLNFSLVDFNAVLKNVLVDIKVSIEQSNAEITFEELPSLYCDATQIRLLFQNLISNAIKYSKKNINPVIKISYNDLEDSYEFQIIDNGIGIDPKYTNSIFEVFRRLHSNQEYAGTGIGLANCKRIVENHNGKIWVESKENEGATFYFTIPK